MAEKNTADIGFEQQIWAAADILRGNMDAAEYKHVVLGLIFLKYISDKFEARYHELEADNDDVEDKDAYAEENVFFVPPSARWSVISEAAHKEEIGTVIDDAMRAIEKENKRLKDILPKNYARDELDKRRLGNVVDLFTNIQMVEHGDSKDILGRAYEYCLAKFAEQEGKRAGEFYTPSCDANFAWLQHMIYHLSPNGKIGMVLANGSLSSQSGGEGEIRRKIVEAGLVEGIIAMPTQLFYTTQIPVSLWFISRNKKQKGKTLFIDARKMGTMLSRKLREMTGEDIGKIAATFDAFNGGMLEDVKGFCAAVTTEEIAKQDYILTPGRYVGIEEQEDDGEPFEEKMTRLTGELSEMFKRSHELEEEIRQRLGQ
ncbi:MAG: type I restriction-modification system subunit M [Spirochaetia bacterium]|jgi:type I restriction-modification system DNA methylase subunit|nr:type I restriction-modification system subunit M [Spirochaetia bacterium]